MNCGGFVSDQPKQVMSYKLCHTQVFEAKIAGGAGSARTEVYKVLQHH